MLFYGPPGLGKTTLASIIAKEMNTNIRIASGPTISKAGDLAAILTNLQKKDILFIDEIHRLPTAVEEILYSAMEDFKLDLVIGEGPMARVVKINLQPFTLVGATTRLGMISNPLRTRFGIPMALDFYSDTELSQIVMRAANIFHIYIVHNIEKDRKNTYENRFKIETMFKNFKSGCFDIEKTKIKNYSRIKKMLFIYTMAYCIYSFVGSIADKNSELKKKFKNHLDLFILFSL